MGLAPKLKLGNQDGIKPPQESVNCRPFFNGGSFFSPRRRLGRFPRLNQGRRVDAVNDAWNSTYGKRCPRFAGTMDHRPPARVESPGDRSRRRAVRLLGRHLCPGPPLAARTGPRVDLAALPNRSTSVATIRWATLCSSTEFCAESSPDRPPPPLDRGRKPPERLASRGLDSSPPLFHDGDNTVRDPLVPQGCDHLAIRRVLESCERLM